MHSRATLALTLIVGLFSAVRSGAQTIVTLNLTDGGDNGIMGQTANNGGTAPLDLGFFTAGTLLSITATGHGDLVNSGFQVTPNGSLYVPATGSFTAANPGAAYPTTAGGDGINHFVGGGANYTISGGSQFTFAGAQTTDTTNPADIRGGAIVGTFSSAPTIADWFLVGTGGVFTIPAGGAHLYLAVNDTFNANGDNHGSYTVTFAAVPEPSTWALLLVGCGFVAAAVRPRRRSV